MARHATRITYAAIFHRNGDTSPAIRTRTARGHVRETVLVCRLVLSDILRRWRNPHSAKDWRAHRARGRRHSVEPAPSSGERIHDSDWKQIVSRARCNRGKQFEHEALQELVDSIREHGIIQPLIVRQVDGRHELIAGERRLRAAQELGLTEVPVIVRSANDLEVLELSLIENLQRADLNPIEEAQAYARLAGEFSMRQEDIAQKVGRSRAAVANSMRLLDLHPQVQTWVTQDLLSVGHAKVLLGLKAAEEQLLVAETVLRRSATVRATERLVARQLGSVQTRRRRRGSAAAASSPAVIELQNRLQQYLGTHVVFITTRNAVGLRSNITATTTLSGFSAQSGCREMTSDRGRTTWSF